MNKYLASLEKYGMNLGLKRIKSILAKLDNPQNKFQSIHIAGTNGKGSTAVMIASILKEAGYKVGLYTSPHFFDYTERIKINGQNIPQSQFKAGLKAIKNIVKNPTLKCGESKQPTVFEVLTALAFWYFAQEKVDYAVVEVGLGGRLDATNVLTPLVSIITNIDLEHTEVLGKTLTAIAKEKAAIIKPGVPVVTAEKKREPLNVIRKAAAKAGSLLVKVEGYDSVRLRHLQGEHQKLNAACAVAAVRLSRIIVTPGQVKRGLELAQWPGRFQIISNKPTIIVDGAHNPAGAKVLRASIQQRYSKKFTIIYGCQGTKDYLSVLNELKPIVGKLIVTRSSHPESQDPQVIYDRIKWSVPVQTTHSLTEALSFWDQKSPLLVTGSLFLLADYLKINSGTPH